MTHPSESFRGRAESFRKMPKTPINTPIDKIFQYAIIIDRRVSEALLEDPMRSNECPRNPLRAMFWSVGWATWQLLRFTPTLLVASAVVVLFVLCMFADQDIINNLTNSLLGR
jgi:hypothetical protein